MDDLKGKQFGPYRIIAPLGEGGMATVYRAYQPGVDRYVAIKVLPRFLAQDAQFVGRFKQEAQIVARLQHPHILPVFDYGEAEGFTYIVMPFIKSGTLDLLLRGGPLPLPRIRRIIGQMGEALDYAHRQGVVHRDIKPSNILVDDDDNCLLTDFGIARIYGATSRFTNTGGLLGTPTYMSPEQGQAQAVDHRSDIYSLGVVLYEMATGNVPFRAETPIAVVLKHIRDPLPLPCEINSELPEAIQRVILTAMDKSPENRFQSAGEMARALFTQVSDYGNGALLRPYVTTPPVNGKESAPATRSTSDEASAVKGFFPRRQKALVVLFAIAVIAILIPQLSYGGFGIAFVGNTATMVAPSAVVAVDAAMGTPTLTATLTATVSSTKTATSQESNTPEETGSAASTPTVDTPLKFNGVPTSQPSATVTQAATKKPSATISFDAASTATPTEVRPTVNPPTATNSPPPSPTAEPPPGFVEQSPYDGDCTNRVSGSVCLRYIDGYTWLVYDAIQDWERAGSWNGHPIDVAVGYIADYHHIVGTWYVWEERK